MLPNTMLNPKVMPVVASASEMESSKATADTIESTFSTAMLANTVVMIFVSGPLQSLLSSVKQLQIIVHIMLIDVSFPPTMMVYMGMFMSVLTF